MYKKNENNETVVTDSEGNKTVIAPPEDLTAEIGTSLSIDFESDAYGVQ